MSRDADDEYFSDGLAEEIINALAQVPELKVIARTSAFAFKGKNEDIRRIADALGVTNILEGSVRRAGSRVRVTAQLIHAADGTHLWSQRYDREMSDIFAVQDEMAAAIATALKLKLVPAPERRMPSLPAYEAYLKYRSYQWQFTPEAASAAANAWRRRSRSIRSSRCHTSGSPTTTSPSPPSAAYRRRRPRHLMHGNVLGLGHADEACAAARRSVELDPQFWLGWVDLAILCAIRGEHAEAMRYAEKAMAAAPWSPYSIGLMSGALANAGLVEKAEPLLDGLREAPYGGPVGLAIDGLVRGDIDGAVEWAGKAAEQRFPVFIPRV